MSEYLFVLGKNPKLSIAEIESYLEKSSLKNKIIEETANFAIFDINEHIEKDLINHLGGTLKIAKIEKKIPKKDLLEKEIENIELNGSGKYFGISLYPEDKPHNSDFKLVKKISMLIKKKTKLKFFSYPKDRKFPELIHVEIIKKKLLENSFEIIIGIGKNTKYIGMTIQVHNPFEFKKRDVGRPNQRAIFSIPPRLAKIMINLSECKSTQKLLDPFCGLGTIIQESLLEGINAYGVDNNEIIVKSSKENLKWLKDEYYLNFDVKDIIREDDSRELSSYFPEDSFDAIVTEPYLGPPLRSETSLKEAEEILEDLRKLFVTVFKEFHKVLKLNGKIVIVIPSIRSNEGIVDMDDTFTKETGFSVLKIFNDFGSRHKTLRKIYVIEKTSKNQIQ